MDIAVIFDMDGVIVDNGRFHQKAWREFCLNYNIPFTDEKFQNHFFGRTNEKVLPEMFNRKLTPEEIEKYGNEKEEIYRNIYGPHAKPLAGLVQVLEDLTKNRIPVGIATSAPTQNVNFILDTLKIRNYFNQIVDDSMVSHSKPHPRIYLKTAELLRTKPENCVVFEDSLSGTKSAFDAGAKVVAVTTTLPAKEHKYAHITVPHFKDVTLQFLRNIFQTT